MVNIQIHQFQPGGASADAAALEQFQQQWTTYQKLVDADCLAHKQVGAILHDTLVQAFAQPFSLLDIACGDASEMRQALAGTDIRHYHGIDLSEPALELAATNLEDMSFEVELDHRDFIEALSARPEAADVSWCSLSIYHLPTDGKRRLIQALRDSTRTFLMVYEPTREDGETREEYLERFRRVNRPAWTMLTQEAAAAWLDLGRQAGFSQARQLFLDPTGFYGLYRYDR